MTSTPFITAARLELDRMFTNLGFRREQDILWKDLSASASGSLGLACTAHDRGGVVTVLPVVGVRYGDLYDLGVSLSAYPESRTNTNLYSALQQLHPARPEYELRRESDNAPVLSRLVRDVENYGYEFFQTYADPAAALSALQRGAPDHLTGVSEFIPLALFRAGAFSRAVEAAARYAASKDLRRPSGRRYHAFFANLKHACASAARGTPPSNRKPPGH